MVDKEVHGNQGYTILKNNILDNPILNMQEQSLLIAIISYYHKEKGYAYPSYEQLKLRSKIKDNRTLNKNIKTLIEKKFIEKETVKGIGCKYYVNLPSGELHHVENSTTCKNTLAPSGELHYDLVENSTTTNTNTNTITNTNIYSATENKDSEAYVDEINKSLEDDLLSKIKKEFPKDLIKIELDKLKDKHINELDLLKELENNLKASKKELNKKTKSKSKEKIYMSLAFIDDVIDKVKITKEQYDKLINKFNKELVHNQILQLDNYIINGKGKKYKDHYRVLNTWCNKNNKDFKPKEITISDEDIEY